MARKRISNVTASSTLSKNQSGSLLVLDNAAGLTVTLPDPGRGIEYDFVIKTAITAGTGGYVISGGTLRGVVAAGKNDTDSVKLQVADGSTTTSISTTSAAGGLVGTTLKLVCDRDGIWNVSGLSVGGGTTTIFA